MPIQLSIWERRDNGDVEAMGDLALELCRIVKARDGIRSAKYYWGGDGIVFIMEGERDALDNPETAAPVDYRKAGYSFGDNAKMTLNLRLMEPRTGEEQWRSAGR